MSFKSASRRLRRSVGIALVGIWQRLCVLSLKFRKEPVFYLSTVKLLRWWFAMKWVPKTFHPFHLRTLEHFIASTQLEIEDFDDFAARNLVNYVLTHLTNNGEFPFVDDDKIEGFFEVQDLTRHQYMSYDQRRLIFVMSKGHFSAIHKRWRPNGKNVYPIGMAEKSEERQGFPFASSERVAARSLDLFAAVKTLQKDGLVLLPGSGQSGTNKIILPILNLNAGFLSTFAFLSITTGAVPIHLSMNLAASGLVQIILHEQIESDPTLQTKEQQIEDMVTTYAKLYENLLRKCPEGFRIERMRQLLAGPYQEPT